MDHSIDSNKDFMHFSEFYFFFSKIFLQLLNTHPLNFRIIKFFFLNVLGEATLESKAVLSIRNAWVFLLNTSKTCSNVELFSSFPATFFGTNYRDQHINNVIEATSCSVDQLSKNIVYIMGLKT